MDTPKTEAIIATVETIQNREELLAIVEAALLHLDAADALLSDLKALAQAEAQSQAQAAAQYDDGAMRSRRHIGDPDAPQPSCPLAPSKAPIERASA